MKVTASTKWGATTKIMRLFYIAYIRAKLNYGSILYLSAAATHLKKIETLQNSCMRMMLGARMSTPILYLQAEAHIQPLYNSSSRLSNSKRIYQIIIQAF